MNNPMNGTDPTGYMRRRPNNRERGKGPTGGGVNWDYFEFVPSIFDQIDESVKRRASKYSALTYEELQELKKRDKEEADKAKQAKENEMISQVNIILMERFLIFILWGE
jgi:hypothetical protein